MKKKVLTCLFVLPLVASCNQNSNGFVNPFPNDNYDKNLKVGFKFASDEIIIRSLTEREKKNINDTIDDVTLPKYLTKKTGSKHIRDYTRAFAGEFKQGYATYNMMEDSSETVTFQQRPTTATKDTFTRQITTSNSSKTTSYSYGDINEELATNTYRYFSTISKTDYEDLTIPLAELKYNETFDDKVQSVNNRVTKIQNKEYKKTVDQYIHSKESTETESDILNQYFYISQKDYIWVPDSNCGADKDDNAILVKSEQNPYKKGTSEGIYELQDGRKYKAMTNSITVSKLKLIKENTELKDRYIVTKVRKYSEDIITSDVIQPNVPTSILATPIPLHYEEEYYSFDYASITSDNTPLIEESSREVIE